MEKESVPVTFFTRGRIRLGATITKNPVSKERHKKKNPWFHGLGLQNVTSVVEQYGGCAEYNKKQEEFENMILIPYVSEGEEENEAK